jgi:RHS repeat-associated protein
VTGALVSTMLAVISPAAPQANADAGSAASPVASRPDALAARMAAKKQGSRVEVLDARTDASQTFANPDGTFTYSTFAQPKWVKQNGVWKDLDASLVQNTKTGTWSPAVSESSLVLSGGGTGQLATMTVDGKQLSLAWPNALPKPTASGPTLTYANVLASGVDLQVTATPAGGAEETLVIKNATAAADPGLADLTQTVNAANGTTVKADAGGNLSDTTSGGTLLVNSPAPLMWDSATTADATTLSDASSPTASASTAAASTKAPGLGRVKVVSLASPGTHSTTRQAGSRAHMARVGVSLKNHKLHLTADHSLLTAKTTVYPVYEDPAFVPHPASGTTMNFDEVQQAYPTTSNYDTVPTNGLGVGFQGFTTPTGIERAYYQLSIPSAIAGSNIISASLNTTVSHAGVSTSSTDTVNVFSTCYISASTTWNNQPCKATSANPNYPNPNASATFTTASATPNQAVAFDVTSGMQQIANKSANNWTLGLYNGTETDDTHFVRFAANPTFSITYNHAPAVPGTLQATPLVTSTTNLTISTSAAPTLSAVSTDPDGDDVTLSYEVSYDPNYPSDGSGVLWTGSQTVNSGATSSVTMPATVIGSTRPHIRWRVQASDGRDTSAWSGYHYFTFNTNPPNAPNISCPDYTSGTWSTHATAETCTLSTTSGDGAGYYWSLDNPNPTTALPDPAKVGGNALTFSVTPTSGWHTLYAKTYDDAYNQSTVTALTFGVGTAGLDANKPGDQASTATTLPLKATAPPGSTSVTFKYRTGTTGGFTSIPASAVTNNGSAVTWPLATVTETNDVTTPTLTWSLPQTVTDDGLLQVEAEFTNGSTVIDTPPVNVTLNRLGTGTDFGTAQVGPVTVGLQSGNASVSSNDVSIASYGAGLSVTRTFNSLEPNALSTGFGPGWAASLPTSGNSFASVTDDGSYALLTGQDGSTLTFAAGTASGGTTPYTGQGSAAASGLTLTKNASGFTLTSTSGTVATFTLPTGGVGGLYLPTSVTKPGSAKSTGYIYDPNSDATQGKLMLMVAPNAATSTANTTACPYPATSASWAVGCRGLQFGYDSTTGNVNEVDFLTTDGTTLTTTPVAKYTYDASGRLATEWDPRISPALVTTYTYNESGSSDPDNGRLTQISPAQQAGSNALAPWVLAYNDTAASADYGKLASVSRTHNSANGGGTAKTVIAYSVPLTVAAGGPADMDATTVANWGQTDVPTSAVAIFPPDHAPASLPPTDWTYAQLHYYDANGREVNTASYNNGWNITTAQYDQFGNDVRDLTAANRATALAAGSSSALVASQLDTENIYSSDGTELIDTYGPTHQAMAAGTIQPIRTHTHQVYDQGAPNNDQDANGSPYQLVTSQTVSASLGTSEPGAGDVDTRSTSYVYNNGTDNIGWTLHAPLQTITDPGTGNLNITKNVAYNENASLYGGEPLQVSGSQPSDTAGTGAGTTTTVYYTAGSNSVDSACGSQPAWTDLVCKTEPVAQPGTAGFASLPVTQYTYNTNLAPLTTTQTYTAADGSTATRTTSATYDTAGRQVKSSITTSGTGMGTAVPPTESVYSQATGLPTDVQSLDGNGQVTADLYTTYDDWGQKSSYTDATSQVTSYSYDLAGRITGRSDSGDSTTLTYNGGNDHSGNMTSEVDTKAGTFTASYTPDGGLATETYPGGTVASYTFDSTATATGLTYTNTTWAAPLRDSVTTNAAGDWSSRSVLAGSQSYSYDAADRLSSVADTQSGQCTTRSYSYDLDSNRVGQATGATNSDGTCQTSSTTTQNHTYDSADRITNSGYTYDTLGDITTTPAVDAGGSSALTATYFANGMLASQNQAGDTQSWQLDPNGERLATQTDSVTGTVTTNHYADDSDNPSLMTNSNGTWMRNVTGPAGLLAQVSSNGVTLELADLHGDVMATVDPANGVTATYTFTEFGVAESAAPSVYGWYGNSERSQSGVGSQALMGVRGYNPYTGRFDQIDPVTGSSSNAYDLGAQNPLTHFDESGKYWHSSMIDVYGGSGWFAFVVTRSQWLLDRQSGWWGLWGSLATGCAEVTKWWVAAVICSGVAGFAANVLASEVRANSWPVWRGFYFKYGCRSHWWGCSPWWGYYFTYSYWG